MNGQKIKIGEKYGTFTVIGTEKDKKNKTLYILKCQCGAQRKRVGFFVKKAYKCIFCINYNLIGKKNRKTTYIKYIKDGNFECLCDCGTKFIGDYRSKSCGCHKEEDIIEDAKKLIGISPNGLKILNFERLDPVPRKRFRVSVFKAQCPCGKIFEVKRSSLNKLKSCGCRINKKTVRLDQHYKTKLSNKDVLSIIELYLTGLYSRSEIAKMMNVHPVVISNILLRKSWKTLQVPKKSIKNSPIANIFGKARIIEEIVIGKKYKNWLVIQKSESKNKRSFYLCECVCKRQYQVSSTSLRSGKTSQCSICQKNTCRKYDFKNFVGKKIRNKTILQYFVENKIHKFKTLCNCGNVSVYKCHYIINNKKNNCKKCYPRKSTKKSISCQQPT